MSKRLKVGVRELQKGPGGVQGQHPGGGEGGGEGQGAAEGGRVRELSCRRPPVGSRGNTLREGGGVRELQKAPGGVQGQHPRGGGRGQRAAEGPRWGPRATP